MMVHVHFGKSEEYFLYPKTFRVAYKHEPIQYLYILITKYFLNKHNAFKLSMIIKFTFVPQMLW